jgi:hypothetical protein
VDFPDPLSPTIKTNSPFLMCRLTSLSAGTPVEYDLLTDSIVIMLFPLFYPYVKSEFIKDARSFGFGYAEWELAVQI